MRCAYGRAKMIAGIPNMARYVTFFVSVFCLAAIGVIAADPPEFSVVPLSGPDGMVLIIGGPLLHPSTASANGGWIGYHIYRKAPGESDFSRLTKNPLSRPGSLAELEKRMGGPIDGFEKFAGLSSKQELWQSIETGDTAIIPISFLSKNFRTALGLMLVDTKVERDKMYEYRATLVATDGTESSPSEPQSATFGVPLFPLLGPVSVKGTSTEQGVEISWAANPADSAAYSYSVYRCPDTVGAFLKLNLAALTLDVDSSITEGTGSFVDTTARPGRTWYYAVVSTDYAGNESPRKPLVPITVTYQGRLPIPQNLFANPTDRGITLTWDTVAQAEIAGYNVYRSLDADSHFVKLNPVLLPPDTGFYEDKTTSLVDRYFYRVTSVSRSGRESERSARALSLYENWLPPLAPQRVTAMPTGNGILIQWQPNDEPDLQGYYVYRADGYNGSLSQVSQLIGKDTTNYQDTSPYLSSAGQYWYLVQAINYTGLMSSFSVPAAARIVSVDTAEAPRSFFGYADGPRVCLFWGVSPDNPASGYHIYRSLEADSLSWLKLTVTPLGRTTGTFVDSTPTMGSSYLYQVRAVSDDGIEGLPSHDLRITLFEPAPLPPAGVRITAEGNALKVIWNATLQQSVAGYRVYRRSDSEPATLLTADPVSVATTEFRDATVKKGIRYYYAIACVARDGREGHRSAEVAYFRE